MFDLQHTQATEAKLADKTFDEIDALHEAAVGRQDVALQRVIEQQMREKWPTVRQTPEALVESLAARARLETRIKAERAARVPASVREGLAAIEKSWNHFQFKELRAIAKRQRFGLAG
jgi:hypothetical protein